MFRIDWGNPKISINELETFLSNYLTTNYDGILQDGSHLNIVTYSPLNSDQEYAILSYIGSLNGYPTQTQFQAFASKVLPNGKKLYKREHGIQTDLITGYNYIYYTIPYNAVKIIGVEILFGEKLDYTDLYILDSTAGTYSTVPNYPLNQFGFSVNIAANAYEETNNYDADLLIGMQIMFRYYSHSDKTIAINFNLSEVKT